MKGHTETTESTEPTPSRVQNEFTHILPRREGGRRQSNIYLTQMAQMAQI